MIPTWNGREILERNLPSVRNALQEYPEDGEVLVVDDGSRDGTLQWLARTHPWVRAIGRASNEGFGAAVNAGAGAARGRLIVLLNNDMRVEPGFLSPLTAPFSSGEGLFSTTPRIFNRSFGGDEAVTACTFRHGLFETVFLEREGPESQGPARQGPGSEGPGQGTAAAAGNMKVERESDANERSVARPGAPRSYSEVLFACGGAAAFDRSLWLALGGLDPLFAPFYWEDVDLSWRARKRGWRILHVPESVVHHEHSATIGARFDRRQVIDIYERNRLLFQWKNLTSPRLTASHLAWLPFRLVRAVATRREFLRGLVMALPRIGEARRARRFERTIEKLTDEEILARFKVGRRRR